MEMIEDIIDTEEISAEMLKGDKQYFGLKIKGTSMIPMYFNGDVVIFEKAEDCAKENNIETLSLEVAYKNITAYLLYKKLGFVERRTRKNYYNNGDDAIEMIKRVD